jgi:hypothetical protein
MDTATPTLFLQASCMFSLAWFHPPCLSILWTGAAHPFLWAGYAISPHFQDAVYFALSLDFKGGFDARRNNGWFHDLFSEN